MEENGDPLDVITAVAEYATNCDVDIEFRGAFEIAIKHREIIQKNLDDNCA